MSRHTSIRRSTATIAATSVAVVLSTVVLTVASGTVAGASPPIIGTGTLNCTNASGSISFTPALATGSHASTTVKVDVVVTDCSAGSTGSGLTVANATRRG